MNRRTALVGFLFFALAASAGADDGKQPRLGVWEMTVDDKPGGRVINVSFLRRDGDQTLGVIEYWPDGQSQTLELFVARFDPTRRTVRFDGREVHTRVPGLYAGTYEADLSADGRTMTRFRNITIASTGVLSTLKWAKTATPAYSARVEASLRLTGEANLLSHQLSASYLLDDMPVWPGADEPLLERLARSTDARTRELAKAKSRYLEFVRQTMAEDAKAAASLAKDDLARRAEIFKFIASAVRDDGGSPRDVGGLMKAVGLEKAFDRKLAQAQAAVVQTGMFNRFRAELRADYEARGVGARTKLPAEKLVGGYRADGNRGYVTLRNETGRDLHHCRLISRMTPDPKKVDEFERQVRADNSLGAVMGPVFGMNFAALANAQVVMTAYHRLEKGVPVFVPLWPKGSTVTFEVAMADATRESAASVGVWAGADEGQAEIELELKEVIEIARAAAPKPRSGGRPRPTAPTGGTGLTPRSSAPKAADAEGRPSPFGGRPSPQGSRPSPFGGRPGGFGPGGSTSAPNPGGGDLLHKGAVWRGREQSPVGYTPIIEIEVVEREGSRFKAEMRWSGRMGRIIEGTVKDGVVEWHGARGERNPGTPHAGKLNGAILEGDFTLPGREKRLTFKYEHVPPAKR